MNGFKLCIRELLKKSAPKQNIRHISFFKCKSTLNSYTKHGRTALVLSRGHHCAGGGVPEFLTSPLGEIEISNISLHDYMWDSTSKWPDHVAIECGVTGRKYTYGQLKKLSDRVTGSLQHKFRLKKHDCIAVILPNIPEYPLIFLGASQAGLTVSPVNPIYVVDEISRQLLSSSAKLIFTIPDKYEAVNNSLKITGLEIPVVVIKDSNNASIPQGAINFEELIDSSVPEPVRVPVDKDDVLTLPYSSGTTGLPKGVQLTHQNVVSNLVQISHPSISFTTPTTGDHQEVVIGVLPFFHIYGLSVVLFKSLSDGCKVMSLPKFEPKSYMNAVTNKRGTILYIVPPLVLFLGSHPDVKKEDLASVKRAVSGAAPCGEKDADRLRMKLNPSAQISQGYGLTEASPVVLTQRCDKVGKLASVGVAIPSTKVKIMDLTTNHSLGPHQVGELYVSGPQVMKGYLNNPIANQDIFDENGWLRTGDLGYYDDDGDFFVVDRLKELIKVKGFQVAPAELEELLRSHPKIADAAVIGIPNTHYGEVPKAFVVPKTGTKVTEKEISDFVAGQVSSHKKLAGGVEFLETIPKSAAGKILRKELRLRN